MKKPVVLFRRLSHDQEEISVAKKHFPFFESRMELKDQLVIGRYISYGVLQCYKELENDLKHNNSELINSYNQHLYIADFAYYEDVKHLTPKTWFNLADVPKDGGPFILRGKTNSMKHQWQTKMFAKNYLAAANIYGELLNDSMISDQGVIIREYVPLKALSESVTGMPFANEWRFFFYKNELLSAGYYWCVSDVIPELKDLPKAAYDKAKEAAEIISDNINFFVVDVAETATGEWILIEVNDGQMSGLNGLDPEVLYQNLAKALKKEE